MFKKKIRKVRRQKIDIDGDKKPDIIITTETITTATPDNIIVAEPIITTTPIVEEIIETPKPKCKTKNCNQEPGPENYQGYCGSCARCFKII